MQRKGNFKVRVWKWKEGLKEEFGKERKVWRKSMESKERFKGSVREGK